MNKIGTNNIETERLLLRKIRLSDAEAVYENWANDPEVAKYLAWEVHASVEETRRIIQQWIEIEDEPLCFRWAMELKEIGQVIGVIDCANVSAVNERCEIGYSMARRFWNRGLMTESLRAVIDYLFQQVEMNRIEAKHLSKNVSSGRVMEKAGMNYEGTLRRYARRKRGKGFEDVKIYSILREDYDAGNLCGRD